MLVIGVAADLVRGALIHALRFHAVEQRLGLGITKRAFVAEQDELAACHLAARGRAVVVEHIAERLPQQVQIIFGKAKIGRAHVCTPVPNAHLELRLLLEKKKTIENTTKLYIKIRDISKY